MTGDPPRDAGRIRAVLLGLEGPYADVREAIDALDNLAVLAAGLDRDGRHRLATTLCRLTADDDPIVATGAALGLDHVLDGADPGDLLDTAASGPGLDRTPVGFSGRRHPTLRGEVLERAARVAGPAHAGRWAAVLDRPPDGVEVGLLASTLAPHLPGLIIDRARERFTGRDTGVLARLPTHWHRMAFAGALRPWPHEALDAVSLAGTWQHWPPADTAALLRVMRDEDPALTRPEGLDDPRRWWIVAGEPWNWAVWRAEDGALALEVLRAGWSQTAVSAVLDPAQAAAFTTGGIGGIAPLVDALRDAPG